MTYDPRGVTRSPRTDDATESTPQLHARGRGAGLAKFIALTMHEVRCPDPTTTRCGPLPPASWYAGFLGGEFGQHGDLDAFAPALRAVLDR